MPYRVVFAVATTEQVLVYATDQVMPLAILSNIHYASINDLTWVSNSLLVACSSDGYCSFMSTSSKLIGKRLPNEKIEDEQLRAHFEEMDKVDIERLEAQVKSQKGSQFTTVAFRSKRAGAIQVVSNSTPSGPQLINTN